jgi:flagellar hook-associated protein 2
MANSTVDGLVSGLDTSTIISQLMKLERQPQDRLKTQKSTEQSVLSVYQTLNAKMVSLQTASVSLSHPADWNVMKATSSDPGAVTATAGPSATSGTLSFTVGQLARAGAVASSATVSSLSAPVASGPFLVSVGADQLGFAHLGSGAGLTVGSHSIEVTAATSGAIVAGTGPLAASTTFAADATLAVTVDGAARTYTIRAGTYSANELAAEVQRAAGGDLTASVGAGGELRLVTAHEGSAATLAVTGGTAAASLLLDTGAPAAQGGDGTVVVDGGPALTVTSAGAGISTSLAGPGGTVAVTFSGGLRRGTVTATNVAAGDGTLGSLVDAINRAKAGVTAAAVNTGPGAYRLQLTSTTTGAGSNVTAGAENLIGLGPLSTVQAGRDAVLHIGEGGGAYDITSATNTVAGVLPGVTLQLTRADPATTVSVDVAADGDGLADRVAKLVDAANGALSYIKSQASYDPDTKKAGPLLSDGTARLLQAQVLNAVSDAVGGNAFGSAGLIGLSTARDGSITFDKAKFQAAYAKDPAAVAAMFRQGGVATDASVSFLSASAKTVAGTYAVVISQAAARAEATGTALAGGGLAANETIDVRVGGASGTTATYAAAAGETLGQVATGLNAAFVEKSLALYASVESGTLVVRSSAYGSAAAFEVRSSAVAPGNQTNLASVANQWETHQGLDVAGTINGVAATGTGQALTAPANDATLGGLSLAVTALAPGALGTFTYTPGVAQRLNSVASAAIAFGTGSITNAVDGRQSLIRDLDSRIGDWDTRLALRESELRRQFGALETALGKLRDQSNWLAGQLAGLSSSSGR